MLSIVLPVIMMTVFVSKNGWNNEIVYKIWVTMGLTYLTYGAGVFFYVSRFPESKFPGKNFIFFEFFF